MLLKMAKFPEATHRLFSGIFVCKKCKTKIRTNVNKVLQGKVKCRRCGSKELRPIKKAK